MWIIVSAIRYLNGLTTYSTIFGSITYLFSIIYSLFIISSLHSHLVHSNSFWNSLYIITFTVFEHLFSKISLSTCKSKFSYTLDCLRKIINAYFWSRIVLYNHHVFRRYRHRLTHFIINGDVYTWNVGFSLFFYYQSNINLAAIWNEIAD